MRFHAALRAAVLVAAGAATLGAALAQSPPPVARVARDGDAIVFEGRIDAASVAAFRALAADPAVTRLVITSPGGLVDEALAMATLVHERRLDVEVPDHCLSSCANYVFPAARRKRVARPGMVAWHGNMAHVLHLQRTGQGTWSDAQMASARRLAAREDAFFARIGVDGFVCWVGKLPPYAVDGYYWLGPVDMGRFGIGEVTIDDPTPLVEEGLQAVVIDWEALPSWRPPGP
jgi:hypothetical protein